MEGPQFSTLAESELYRAWGCNVIGMTNMPEAKLAREAELCYATVAMVTDYDCWHPDHDARDGRDGGEGAVRERGPGARIGRGGGAAPGPARGPCPGGCDHALEYAIITAPERRDPDLMRRLDAVAGRMLRAG